MRNKLFFKPVAGFGGRAAYRGDKITRRVWQNILEGGYVASRIWCRRAVEPLWSMDGER